MTKRNKRQINNLFVNCPNTKDFADLWYQEYLTNNFLNTFDAPSIERFFCNVVVRENTSPRTCVLVVLEE
jgi:hypothetical protein